MPPTMRNKKKRSRLAPNFKQESFEPIFTSPPVSRKISHSLNGSFQNPQPYVPLFREQRNCQDSSRKGYQKRRLRPSPSSLKKEVPNDDVDKEVFCSHLGLGKELSVVNSSQSSLLKMFSVPTQVRYGMYKATFPRPLPITSPKTVVYEAFACRHRLMNNEVASFLVSKQESSFITTKLWPTEELRFETLNRPSVIPDSSVEFQSRDWIEKRPKARELRKKEQEKLQLKIQEENEKKERWRNVILSGDFSGHELQWMISQLRQKAVVQLDKCEIKTCRKCSCEKFILQDKVIKACSCPSLRSNVNKEPI